MKKKRFIMFIWSIIIVMICTLVSAVGTITKSDIYTYGNIEDVAKSIQDTTSYTVDEIRTQKEEIVELNSSYQQMMELFVDIDNYISISGYEPKIDFQMDDYEGTIRIVVFEIDSYYRDPMSVTIQCDKNMEAMIVDENLYSSAEAYKAMMIPKMIIHIIIFGIVIPSIICCVVIFIGNVIELIKKS